MVRAFTIAVATIAAIAPVLAAPTHRAPRTHHVEHPVTRSYDIVDGELDAREPKFKFKKAFSKIGRVAKSVSGIAMKAAPLLLRDVEYDDFDARELEQGPIGQVFVRDEDGALYVRELDAEELGALLEAREPKFRLKKILKKGLGALKKGMSVAQKVSGVAGQFGLREFDDMEFDERDWAEESLDELD